MSIVMKLQLGEEHDRTNESSECLKHLTQQAVKFQKTMNQLSKGEKVNMMSPIQVHTVLLAVITARSMIGNWHCTIFCPSVCLSVMMYIVAPSIVVEGSTLYDWFSGGDFIFTSLDTFAVGCFSHKWQKKLMGTRSNFSLKL